MPKVQVRNTIKINYHREGRGQALVLLHGLGSSGRDWEYQIPEFARHFDVIAPDFRGSGESDKPRGPYSIADYAEDTWALLDKLDISKAHLVGLSMGGATAFEMAVRRPERVHNLVVVNCPPSFALSSPKKWFELAMRLAIVRVLGMEKMADVVGKRLFPDPGQEQLKAQFQSRYAANKKQHYLWALRSLAGWSALARLNRIDAPAMMLAAEHDYTPVQEKQAAVERLPHGELKVIKNSRHATPIDQPEAFNAAVLAFLQREGV